MVGEGRGGGGGGGESEGGEEGKERGGEERGKIEFSCVSCKPCPFVVSVGLAYKLTLTWLIGLMYLSVLQVY